MAGEKKELVMQEENPIRCQRFVMIYIYIRNWQTHVRKLLFETPEQEEEKQQNSSKKLGIWL